MVSYGFLLFCLSFISFHTTVVGSEISSQDLLNQLDSVQIFDFRSDFSRELNGFITSSVLVPNDEKPEDYIDR